MSREEWAEKFPKRLDMILGINEMTQHDLAMKIGCTDASISRYANGQRIPKATTIIDMAKALSCPVSWLLKFDDIL